MLMIKLVFFTIINFYNLYIFYLINEIEIKNVKKI